MTPSLALRPGSHVHFLGIAGAAMAPVACTAIKAELVKNEPPTVPNR